MSIESIRISSFMTRNVKTETEDQNIQAVCKTMNENNIGSLIIMTPPYDNNPKPVGIITERDVVRIIGQLYPSLQHAPIRELMSKPLITLSTNSSVKDAMQTMQQNNIRRIPIVELLTDYVIDYAINRKRSNSRGMRQVTNDIRSVTQDWLPEIRQG